jgi:hypothetical protein
MEDRMPSNTATFDLHDPVLAKFACKPTIMVRELQIDPGGDVETNL